jgi:hypothetical protein
MQSLGTASTGVIIVLVCAIVGWTHGSSWIVVPAVIAVVWDTWRVLQCRRWYRRCGKQPSPDFARWWVRRGLWLMLAGNIPMAVAIGGTAFAVGGQS